LNDLVVNIIDLVVIVKLWNLVSKVCVSNRNGYWRQPRAVIKGFKDKESKKLPKWYLRQLIIIMH